MTTAVRQAPVALDPVTEYASLVVSGEIVACKLVIQACQRHLDDLRDGHKRGIKFDLEKSARAVRFFSYLRHYKGEWAGEPLTLEPWEQFIVGSLFGWIRADGTRRFRVAYNEIPRKNGKTLLAAGIGLLLAFFDGEGGAEVYAAATKRDQAKIVWGDARTLVRSSEALKKRIQVIGGLTGPGSLVRLDKESKFLPLGQDGDTMDGLNSHGLIIDELHAHKTRATWDVLATSTGARRQPLTFAITTAGADRLSVCYEQHDYGIKVLEKIIDDDSYFVYIATIDEGDNWTDPASWLKANPNYGISVKIDDLRMKCLKAQQIPAEQSEFLRKHLNVWTEKEDPWLLMATYDGNTDEPDLAFLKGKKCFAGLDLSTTQDLTALELYFPKLGKGEEGGDWLHYYFIPRATMLEKIKSDRVPYDVWERQGNLIATPGNVIDYDFIRERVNKLREEGFEIQEIAFDPFNATQIVTDLMQDGFTCVPIRQGFLSLSPPTKELERLLLGKKMRLGKNPVTRWAASNAVVITDPSGNVKLDKSSKRARIDPIAAMVNAVDRASRHLGEAPTWSGFYIPDDDDEDEDTYDSERWTEVERI
jgi:phage terminase large subunit-like protein